MDNAIEKELDATPRRSSHDQQGEYVAASIRMKQGQHAALHRRLKTIMEEYNQAITNFEEKQKEDQKRRIKISGKRLLLGQLFQQIFSALYATISISKLSTSRLSC